MLILGAILFTVGLFGVILFKQFIGSILSWGWKTNPEWIALSIKIILAILVTALIFAGSICVLIVLMAAGGAGVPNVKK